MNKYIKCNNKVIYLTSSKRIGGSSFSMNEFIEEYNIDEILNEDNVNNNYWYPKKNLKLLIDHITTISLSKGCNNIKRFLAVCIHSKNPSTNMMATKHIEIEID